MYVQREVDSLICEKVTFNQLLKSSLKIRIIKMDILKYKGSWLKGIQNCWPDPKLYWLSITTKMQFNKLPQNSGTGNSKYLFSSLTTDLG